MNAPITTIPENIQKLITAAQAPGPLKDPLLAQRASLDLPGLVALAKKHGVDVGAAELEAFAASQPVPTELSDEALASVTGGIGGIFGRHLSPITGGEYGGGTNSTGTGCVTCC
ncbi:MAG: hypothetical protein J0L92_14675 [Deltaproteobacteria bacterium]|nr:hypothetical protein [Deltaproteobacteria bacterium]